MRPSLSAPAGLTAALFAATQTLAPQTPQNLLSTGGNWRRLQTGIC